MNLMFSGEFAKHLLTMTKKDDKLALAMACEFVAAIEPASIANYLLTVDVAIDLLASRIRKNPEQTIADLQRLPMLTTPQKVARRRKAGRPAGSTRTIKKTATRRRKRRRLSADQIEMIKNEIVTFLKQNPGSNRKQITAAVSFPSVAAYNRIMSEMKSDKNILSKGEKSKTVYTIKGTQGARKKTKAKAKAAPAKRSKASKQPRKVTAQKTAVGGAEAAGE